MKNMDRRKFVATASLAGITSGALAVGYSRDVSAQVEREGMVFVDDFLEADADIVATTTGIHAAIEAARSRRAALVFGSGVYYVNAELFMGKIGGKSVPLVIGNGSTIVAEFETPTAVINYQGASFCSIRDLNIESESASIGLVLARDQEGRSANRGLFTNIRVSGAYAVSAVYMACSESNLFQRCFIGNYSGDGKPALLVEKESTVSSNFGISTNTYNRFTDCNMFSAGGVAVKLAGAAGFFFENCIFDCSVGDADHGDAHVDIINNTRADLAGTRDRCADIVFEKCTYHGRFTHSLRLHGGGIMDQIKVRDARFNQRKATITDSHIFASPDAIDIPLNLYNCEFSAPTIDFGRALEDPVVRVKHNTLLDITQLYTDPDSGNSKVSSFHCSGPVQGELVALSSSVISFPETASPSSVNRTTVLVREIDTGNNTQYQ
jgi:hypothetical protein